MKLSICIPTYNRAKHLANCLHSISQIKNSSGLETEICISDNCSSDNTQEIVSDAPKTLKIKYHRNLRNLGIPANFLNVVDMASGEFVWLIGDDDLLTQHSFDKLYQLFNENPQADFFYINSFHLQTDYVFAHPQPFDTHNLPCSMKSFSSFMQSGRLKFLELINPNISFDFLGGMFLAIFRREKWMANKNVLSKEAVADLRTFSYFDNTFPHVKIFSKAFAESDAYFHAEPLSVCLTGAREWAPMYPLVASVRLIEALNEYRKNGLPLLHYLWCRNFALRNFIPHLALMIIHRKRSGIEYVNPVKLVLSNCIFPNFYLSVIYFLLRKVTYIFEKKH